MLKVRQETCRDSSPRQRQNDTQGQASSKRRATLDVTAGLVVILGTVFRQYQQYETPGTTSRLQLAFLWLPGRELAKKGSQRALYCACGRDNILAHGLCPPLCPQTPRRGLLRRLREEVLNRDGYACRGGDAPGRGKRSITVHPPSARACLCFLP
jgi:hypothetical protein